MQNLKEFLRKNRLTIGLSAVIAAITAGSAFIVNIKMQEVASAKASITQANAQIEKLTQDIGTLTSDAEQAKKDAVEYKEKVKTLASDIEAFAKQAAACETLKKQIKIKK